MKRTLSALLVVEGYSCNISLSIVIFEENLM